jgi:hypothetical protein
LVAVDTARSARISLGNGFGLVIPATVTASLASTYTLFKIKKNTEQTNSYTHVRHHHAFPKSLRREYVKQKQTNTKQ